jgi:ATP-dependent RNA helicase DeaD
LNRKTFKLDQVKTVVLDEADEMLKMGFKDELEGILNFVPSERQTLLFSATMPKHVEYLAERYTIDAKRIRITRKEVTNSNITQEFFLVKNMFKREALNRLYQMYMPEQALVFCNTKKSVDETMDALLKLGIPCDKIHGDIEQSKRLKTIERFNRGSLRVLIATDVAALAWILMVWMRYSIMRFQTTRNHMFTELVVLVVRDVKASRSLLYPEAK